MLNRTSLKPRCPLTWLLERHLPSSDQACSSWVVDEKWTSLRRVYSPKGLLALKTAACRHPGKCFCRDPAGCSWGPVFAKCLISFWSAWWSWLKPVAWRPRSAECRPGCPAASPRAPTNRRRGSYHLEKDKAMHRLREETQNGNRQEGWAVLLCKWEHNFPRWWLVLPLKPKIT